MNEPICADCAWLVGDRNRTDLAKEWKCGQSPTSKDGVTGSTLYQQTCYEARASCGVCGVEAKLFKLYEHPQYTPPVRRSAGNLPSADNLLGELGL